MSTSKPAGHRTVSPPHSERRWREECCRRLWQARWVSESQDEERTAFVGGPRAQSKTGHEKSKLSSSSSFANTRRASERARSSRPRRARRHHSAPPHPCWTSTSSLPLFSGERAQRRWWCQIWSLSRKRLRRTRGAPLHSGMTLTFHLNPSHPSSPLPLLLTHSDPGHQ